MNSKKPKVTVLMPVYNGEKYLREAIESILNQTFTDFEFLIINDGSTDQSVEIIESYSDPRIRLVHNGENLGLIATLNKGLDLGRGEYIARMDCDDISLPKRLVRQVAFMDSNPDVGLCGTWLKTFGNVPGRVWRHPVNPDEIRCRLLFESVVNHPTVMMRREMIEKHGLSYDDYLHAEDFQLWQCAIECFPIANLGEVLYLYRITGQNVTRLHKDVRKETVRRIDNEAITRLGLFPTPLELTIHCCLGSYDFEANREFVKEVEAWLLKLWDTNDKTNYYPKPAFEKVLGEKWYKTCYAAGGLGLWSWKKFWRSSLSEAFELSWSQKIKFAVKCSLKYGIGKV